MFKKCLICFLISALFRLIFSPSYSYLYAQSNQRANNSIYMTICVYPGYSVGMNYERLVSSNFTIRTGVYFVVSKNFEGFKFPITLNYMTSNNNKFEIGLGFSPGYDLSGSSHVFRILPAGTIGYRYQLQRESPFLRFGVDYPNYISIGTGYHF